MAKTRGIQRPGDLPLRRSDFQFSIMRLLLAMTAVAVVLAVVQPRDLEAVGAAMLALYVFAFLFYDWSWFRLNRAHQLMQMCKFEEAVAAYTRAIADQPAAADRYCFRAAAHECLNAFEAAAADYTETIRREPRYVPGWIGRARVELNRGNYQNAVNDTTIALCLVPGNVAAGILRGLAYMHLGDYENSLADLDAVLAIDPNSPEAQVAKAAVQQRKNARGL